MNMVILGLIWNPLQLVWMMAWHQIGNIIIISTNGSIVQFFFYTHALFNVFYLICKEYDTCKTHLLFFVLCDYSYSSNTQYQHPGYQQHALRGVPQGVRVVWLLLA